MKKLIVLVLALLTVLGLVFAVNASDDVAATNVASNNISFLYKKDGNFRGDGKGTNGGETIATFFDGNLTVGGYMGGNDLEPWGGGDVSTGSYIIVDLDSQLETGYYLTEIAISHLGNTNYSVYYTMDLIDTTGAVPSDINWIPVVENTKTSGTTRYTINDYAKHVKYVFETAIGFTRSLCEIEVFGIDPVNIKCSHSGLTESGWVDVPNSATCLGVGKQKQTCPDCEEELYRESTSIPPLGHNLVTTIDREGTTTEYGAGTLNCDRCDYSISFDGEINFTSGNNFAYGETTNFMSLIVSSVGHMNWGNSADNLTDGNLKADEWQGAWYAASEDDENEYVRFDFKGTIDLTKLEIWVMNHEHGTLRISAWDDETEDYVVVKELNTYDATYTGKDTLAMTISLYGVTTSSLKLQVLSPTKIENGFNGYNASIGEVYVYGVAEGCGLKAGHTHDYSEFVEYKASERPTCLADGKAIYKCVCNDTIEVDVTASEEFHNYVGEVTTEPTCTSLGEKTYTCEYCGDDYTEEIDMVPHKWSETPEIYSATCQEEGWSKYFCTECWTVDETRITILPIDTVYGHDYSEIKEGLPATCTTPGYMIFDCWLCGKVDVNEPIPANAEEYHLATDWDGYFTNIVLDEETYKELTCQQAGYAKYTCPNCEFEYVIEQELDPESNHVWDEENATEISGGYKYDCKLCDATYEDITLGTFDNPIVAVIGNNTVTYYVDDEYVVYAIEVGADSIITVTIDANAGVYVGSRIGFWGMFESGITTHTTEYQHEGLCYIIISRDAENYTFPATFELDVAEKVYPPLNLGTNNVEIEEAGAQYTYIFNIPGEYNLTVGAGTIVDIAGESFYEGEVVSLVVAEGEKIKVNITAHSVITASVTIAGNHTHDYAKTVVAPTCAAGGYTKYECVCGDYYFEDIVGPTGVHNYEEIERVEATKWADGYVITKCTDCNDEKTEILPMLPATVYYVYNSAEFKNAINGDNPYVKVGDETIYLEDGDIVRVADDTDVKLDGSGNIVYVNKGIIIDLNGNKLTTTYGWSNINLVNKNCVVTSLKKDANGETVRGTIYHTGGVAIIKVWQAKSIENIDFISERANATDGKCGGIAIQINQNGGKSTECYLDSIKNVSFSGSHLKYGIEFKSSGDKSLGSMENVSIVSQVNGIEIGTSASTGTMTNCTIVAAGTAINATASNSVDLDGCYVVGATAASGSVAISADKNTDLVGAMGSSVNTSGIVGYNCTHENKTTQTGDATQEITVCADCGKVIEHNFAISKEVAAEGTVPGYRVYTCKVDNCGRFYTECIHAYTTSVTAPTCTADGYTTYTCKCGYSYTDNVVPATGHSYNAVVTAPTCTTDGYTTYTCACGDTYTDNTVPATGHTYNETVTPATCTEDGVKVYTCACGDTYSETIPATGHNYVPENGEFKCTNCGDTKACVHNWEAAEGGTDATCTEDGTANYECSECHDTKTETIPATGHSMTLVSTVPGAAACLPGTATYECDNCDETKTEVVPATEAHTYSWKIEYVDANGVEHKDGHGCPKCGELARKDEGKNYSTNLGYKILYVSTATEFDTAIDGKTSVDFKVIRFESNSVIAFADKQYAYISAAVTVDLGGCTITCTGTSGKPSGNTGNAPFYMNHAQAQLVNGTINKIEGIRQAIWISSNIDLIEDITINITAPIVANASGIYFTSGKKVNTIRNLTINGAHNNGIELNTGSVDLMDTVKVYALGQAIMLKGGNIGQMTDCVFSGNGVGMFIESFSGSMTFTGCEIIGGGLAVKISGAASGATIDFGDTTFTTSGAAFDVAAGLGLDAIDNAVALVNGKLYTTLDAAIKALEDSTEEVTTFALMNDLVLDKEIVIDKKVNFSLGGGTYKIPVWNTAEYTIGTAPGYTVNATNFGFVVVEGGTLTISGEGTFVGNENSIVENGGEAIVVAGTYVGFNPEQYVASTSCKSELNGNYVVKTNHVYDMENNKDAIDADCNDCGYIRGVVYVSTGVYYKTFEEAINAAVEGDIIYLAANIVIDGEVVLDLTGKTFDFNGYTLTANGSFTITGGTFVQDVTEYVADGYCSVGKVINNKEFYVVAPHNVVAIGEAKAPTCTDDGITAGSMCTLCGTVLEEQTVIPATGHNHVAGEPAEDGSVTYTCSCGDSYVVNNTLISGTYYIESMDMFNATFNNGTLIIVDNVMGMSGTYAYEYVVGTNTVTVVDEEFSFTLGIGGNIALNKGNVLNMVKYIAPVTIVLGENVIEIADINAGQPVIFVADKAGKYTITGDSNFIALINNGGFLDQFVIPEVIELAEGETFAFVAGTTSWDNNTVVITVADAHVCSYVETSRVESTCTVAGSVTYTCSCGDSYTEELELAAHTEEIIPAVPGELRNPGMTSGVKCSECGEILVAPVTADGDFRFAAVSLVLSDSVAASYKVQIPAGFTNVYVVFEMNGVETVVSEYTVEQSSGWYVFAFRGVRLQYMADNIKATVYATKDNVVSANSYSTYSIKTYILNQLSKSTSSAALKTMLSDLLVYGEKTQIYNNYKLDSLMTADVPEGLMTSSTFTSVPAEENVQSMIVNDEATRAIADWKAVSLLITDTMNLQFKLAISPEEMENIEVVITIPIEGEEPRVERFTAEDFTYDAETGWYIVLATGIKGSQYGLTVTGDIYHNGKQISRTVNYSANTYIQKNQNSTNVALRDFLRAAYLYGNSVFKYTYN